MATASIFAFEPLPERFQRLFAFPFADEEDRAAFQIHHNGEVPVSLADADLVDGDHFRFLELRFAEPPLEVLLVDVADHSRADAQVAGDILNGHHLPQIDDQPREALGVVLSRHDAGQDDGSDALAPAALHARGPDEDHRLPQADRRRMHEAVVGSPANNMARPASRTLHGRFRRLHPQFHHPLFVSGRRVPIAAQPDRPIQYARGHVVSPDENASNTSSSERHVHFVKTDPRT